MAEGTHWLTDRLYREEAYSIVSDFGRALTRDDAVEIRYTTNGVLLFLPRREAPVTVTPSDFEVLMRIFEEDPYGPKFKRIRENRFRNDSFYEALVKKAVDEFYPAFSPE